MGERVLNAAFMLWFILHPIAAVHNFFSGIDKGCGHSYGWTGYLLAACYLLAMLTVMALTAHGRQRELARYLGRYWLISLTICALFLFVKDASDFAVIAVLLLLVTPLLALAPLIEWLHIPAPGPGFGVVVSLLCWGLCLRVQRKK